LRVAPDGSVAAFTDSAFSDARSFVSVIINGQLRQVELLPVDGYLSTARGPTLRRAVAR
jgi:hypothetical protein